MTSVDDDIRIRFPTEDDLDELQTLPRWQLDLDDDSVEFDNTTLTVTDKRTGDSFCLRTLAPGRSSLSCTLAAAHDRTGASGRPWL